jgi:hypothetical protein
MAIAPELPDEVLKTNIPDLNLIAQTAGETMLRQPSIIEFVRSDLNDKRLEAADALLDSRHLTQRLQGLDSITWQPPSSKKYPDWFKWDEAVSDEMYFKTAEYCWETVNFYESRIEMLPVHEREALLPFLGEFRRRAEKYFEAAVDGLTTTFEGMEENGNIPNSRIMTNSGIMQAGLERIIIKKNGGKASVYTQPVLEPQAVASGYRAALAKDPSGVEARAFLDRFYEPAKTHINHYDEVLADMPNSSLAGVPHPHATGRDRDRVFDHAKKKRLPRKGAKTGPLTNLGNSIIDYGWGLRRSKQIADANGDMDKIKEKFWDRDVMFNCIYLDNLYQMAELAGIMGKPDDRQGFLNKAELLETEIQTMWNPDAWKGNGAFMNLDKDYNLNPKVSVGSLFGWLLPNLEADQLRSMLKMVDTSFNARFGFPVSPTDSEDSDPGYKERGSIWRDGDWEIVKYLLVERGLCMQAQREDLPLDLRQACVKLALEKMYSSNYALDVYGPPSEFRHPQTGEPQRKRVSNFAWGWLGRFIRTPSKLKYLLDNPEAGRNLP